MSRSLIVLPDDTGKPIVAALDAAKSSIRIKMFVFSEPSLLQAAMAARKRGVKVRVMLNAARRSGAEDNEDTRKLLTDNDVEVRDSNPEFDVTHEKSMVVDDQTAFVQSLNWETKNITQTRDYAVVTSNRHEVSEIAQCFDADWDRQPFDSGDKARLIWCTGNGRERLARFIDSAEHSLWLQNERYQDAVIIERLVRAATRGIKVHIMARPAHTLKKDKLIEGVGGLRIMADVGAKVHKVKGLKLHAKMMLADGTRAVVGSVNLTPGSFDSRRELAIEVVDDDVVDRLHEVAKHDWENSHPLDLSDEGLLADLEERADDAAEMLALDDPDKHHKKNHDQHHDKEHKKDNDKRSAGEPEKGGKKHDGAA